MNSAAQQAGLPPVRYDASETSAAAKAAGDAALAARQAQGGRGFLGREEVPDTSNPGSQAFWDRADTKAWEAANPTLAAQLKEKYGYRPPTEMSGVGRFPTGGAYEETVSPDQMRRYGGLGLEKDYAPGTSLQVGNAWNEGVDPGQLQRLGDLRLARDGGPISAGGAYQETISPGQMARYGGLGMEKRFTPTNQFQARGAYNEPLDVERVQRGAELNLMPSPAAAGGEEATMAQRMQGLGNLNLGMSGMGGAVAPAIQPPAEPPESRVAPAQAAKSEPSQTLLQRHLRRAQSFGTTMSDWTGS